MPKILFLGVLLSGLVVASGCGKDTVSQVDNNGPEVDAGVDAGADAGADAGDDAGPDADTGDVGEQPSDVGHEDVESDTGEPDPVPCDDDYDCAPNQICGDEGFCAACVPNTEPEICDGRDRNCNGEVDEGCDKDGDGYCDAEMVVVQDPTTGQWPAVCPEGPGDCDDTRDDVHPYTREICANVDMNCDGVLPQLILDSPSVIRGAASVGRNAEMVPASSPFQYAVVWEERAFERTVIRFARLTRSASATSGVSPVTTVTGPGRVGVQPTLAWDAASDRYGVAWYGPDEAGGWSIYFAMLEANGAVAVPQVRVDTGIDQVDASTDSLRVVAAGGHFGVFYSKPDGDDLALHYAPFDISAGTLGAPVSFTLAAERTIASASFTRVDDRILLAWAIDARRYYGGALDAATGTATETFGTQPLPGTYSTAALRLFTLYGSPYLLFRSGSNLIVQPIDDGFKLDGPAHTLVTNAADSVFALAESGDDGFTLFYRTTVMTIAHFAQDWTAVGGDPIWTGISAPQTTASHFEFFVHGPSNTLQYLSRQNTSGFFRFFSLNAVTGATLVDGYPITAQPYSNVYSFVPAMTYFDEATQSIMVVQNDPTDGALESYAVAADGTMTLPTRMGAEQPNCTTIREFEGRPRCFTTTTDFELCTTTIEIREYDGVEWPLIASAELSGEDVDERCFVYHPMNQLTTADGADLVMHRFHSSGQVTFHLRMTGIDTYSLEPVRTWGPNGPSVGHYMARQGDKIVVALAIATTTDVRRVSVELYTVDGNGDIGLSPQLLIDDEPLPVSGLLLATTPESAAVILYESVTGSAHFFRRINTQTGDMGPLETFADADTHATSRFIRAAGETIMFNLKRHDQSTDTYSHYLVFVKADGTKIIRPVEAVEDYWRVSGLGVDPDYFVTVESTNYGLYTHAYDADGALITSDAVALENNTGLDPTLYHTGEELRLFIRSGAYVFAGRGTCH